MNAFDPFSDTLDAAVAQPADSLAVVQWGAAQTLLARREFYERHPLDGVALCAQHRLTMPDWLAEAFAARYARVRRAEVASWDDAFGAPYPKGTQLVRVRHRTRARSAIFRDVIDALASDPSARLDATLFERIGQKHNVGKTLAQQLHAEAVAQFGYGGANTRRAIRDATASQPANFRKLAGINRRR